MIGRPGAAAPRGSTAAVTSPSVGLAVAVLVVALNLRFAVASVGPVLNEVKAGLGLSSTGASVLTSAPVFLFGLLAAVAPRLARRFGLHRAILVLVGVLLAGLVLRIGPDTATLFVGTALAAGGIAACNVLIPVIIKRDFPAATGLMMGLYTTAVVGSAAIAAGLTVPIGDAIGHDWRGGLGIWAIAAAIALLLWLPYGRRPDRTDAVIDVDDVPVRLYRDRLAWTVTAFFGLQSLGFYAVLSWLPSFYQDHGYSAASAGGLLSLSSALQIPVALFLPSVASRMRSQVSLACIATAFTASGFAGLLLAPTPAAVLWVVLLGIGQGSTFALALILLVLRTRGHGSTAQLSAMAQSVGYVIAGIGPLVVGALHSATDSWKPPLIVLLVLLVPQILTGIAAGAPGLVASATGPPLPTTDVAAPLRDVPQ